MAFSLTEHDAPPEESVVPWQRLIWGTCGAAQRGPRSIQKRTTMPEIPFPMPTGASVSRALSVTVSPIFPLAPSHRRKPGLTGFLTSNAVVAAVAA